MFNHAPPDYKCPFCRLVAGVKDEHVHSISSDIVFANERVTVFIGLHQWPNNPGNVIVVPNEHYENIFDLPPEYAIDIQRAAQKIALALKAVLNCDGISTRQHNEPAGSQDVWHYHLHVTPRYKNDDFYLTMQYYQLMPEVERAKYAEKLKAKIKIV